MAFIVWSLSTSETLKLLSLEILALYKNKFVGKTSVTIHKKIRNKEKMESLQYVLSNLR